MAVAPLLIPADESMRPASGPLSHSVLSTALALGTVLSLVVCYGVSTQSVVLGSPEGRWVYPYVQSFTLRWLIVALLTSVVTSAMLRLPEASTSGREWGQVLMWVVAALGLQALLRSVTPFTFENIFVSDGANAFYGVTRHYFPSSVLREFYDLRAAWPLHAQSNMPGKLMLVFALKEISRRPEVLAWLVVAVSNLGGVAMYVFVRDLFGDRRVALFSLVLYLFVPAKLFFFPLLNTATPVVVLICASLLVRWLRTGRAIYAALLGVACYGLIFFEPLPLVMGLLFVALMARAVWLGDISLPRLLQHVAVGLAAAAATYGTVYACLGFDLFHALREIGAHAVAFNQAAARPYAVWVRYNPIEFMFGVGLCQVVLFGAALVDGFRQGDSTHSRWTQPITVLCLSLLGVLLVTDVIGVNRGEVIRLWIFLACFFQIPTAYICARLAPRASLAPVLWTTVLQNALGTAMIGFILPG